MTKKTRNQLTGITSLIKRVVQHWNRSKYTNLIVFTFGLVVFILALLNTHYNSSYNSDDVSQQVLMNQWWKLGFGGTWMPPDTFVLKIPIHLVAGAVFQNGGRQLMLSIILQQALAMALIFYSAQYFSKRILKGKYNKNWLYISYIFYVTLASYTLLNTYKNTNLRSFEFGIMFIILVLVDCLFNKKKPIISKARTGMILLGALTLGGLYLYNDPSFLVFLVLPLVVFALLRLLFSHSDPGAKVVLYALIMSVVGYKTWSVVLSLLGFHAYRAPLSLIEYSLLGKNINNGILGVLDIFNANVFGRYVTSPAAVRAVAGLVVIMLLVVSSVYLLKKSIGSRANLESQWLIYFTLQPPVIFLAYVLSAYSQGDAGTARYMVLIPVYFILIFTVFISNIKDSTIRVILLLPLICAIAFNSLHTVKLNYNYVKLRHTLPKVNQVNYDIAKNLSDRNLKKGYASYWSANVNTYFSNNTTAIVPIVCSDTARPFYWLMNEHLLEVKTNDSYLIVNNSEPLQLESNCGRAELLEKFGKPKETIFVNGGVIIYTYNYDIGTKLLSRTTTEMP